MRGTPSLTVRPFGVVGIIPAYAGNTTYHPILQVHPGDHPRICGEHARNAPMKSVAGGSSPHMRGTLAAHVDLRRVAGIIPAYAGNTRRSARNTWISRDHPRICGEHTGTRHEGTYRQGSSPHMRGTPTARRSARGSPRIIPAYAGNTMHPRGRRPAGRDHPRICGEHAPLAWPELAQSGSSPHMRGTLVGSRSTVSSPGIIPAYAGNTP